MRLWPRRKRWTEGEFVLHPVPENAPGYWPTIAVEYIVRDGTEAVRASGPMLWGRTERGWVALQKFDLPAHWSISIFLPESELLKQHRWEARGG